MKLRIDCIVALLVARSRCPLGASRTPRSWSSPRRPISRPSRAQVGGGDVEVKSLALPTQDPHFVDARPNLALAAQQGRPPGRPGPRPRGRLAPGAPDRRAQPEDPDGRRRLPRRVARSSRVLEVPAGQVSRAQGDIHPGGNPHYLFDPRNGAKVAQGHRRAARQDRSRRTPPTYGQRAAEFEKATRDRSRRKLARSSPPSTPPKRKIVVYHRSWIYLETWLGLTEVGAVEPKPGIPPDPAHVAQLIGADAERRA